MTESEAAPASGSLNLALPLVSEISPLFSRVGLEASLSLGGHFWQLHSEYGKLQLFWMDIRFFRNPLQQSVKKKIMERAKKKGFFCNI